MSWVHTSSDVTNMNQIYIQTNNNYPNYKNNNRNIQIQSIINVRNLLKTL